MNTLRSTYRSLTLFSWLVLLFLMAKPASATIRYVNGSAASGGDGSMWVLAYQNLQDAIDASTSGDEIWVAAGTYVPTKDPSGDANPTLIRDKTFYLKNGVKIFGGFIGGETQRSQRNWASNVTILSGDLGSGNKCYHVVLSVADGNTTELDGFTITNGSANGAGSITVEGYSIGRGLGGGMYNVTSTTKITNCIFNGNIGGNGSGLANRQSASITLTNCIVRDNNSSAHGGGIYNAVGSSGTFMNCTIYNNTAGNIGGAGMYNESNNAPTLRNCIIYGNTYGGNPSAIIDDNSLSSVANSLIQGGFGGGNLNTDPLFVSSSNLRLQSTSPAINAGTSSGAPTTDLDGNPRPSGCVVDMGAYEYQENEPEINLQGGSPLADITDGSTSPSTTNHTDFGTIAVNSPLARTYTIQNTGSADLIINSITKIGTNQSEFVVSGISFPLTVMAGNSTTFMVTFTPTVGGTRTATLQVNNNDCNEAVYDFAVQGKGALVYTFNGTTNTDWATASNWTGGVVPTTALLASGDAVVIAAHCAMNDVNISFPSGTSLTVNTGIALSPSLNTYITIASGATLTLSASASMSTGRITNNGTMDIYGSYDAFYMTNNSGGVMNVKSGGSYSCAACAQAFNAGGTVNNDGTLNFGTGGNAGTINNNAGGVISDVAGGAQLSNSGTINNAGTFTSRSSSTTGPFNNTGTFNMPTSCLFTVNGGGTFSNTGGITVPSGSSFNVSASGTLTNNSAGIITNNGTFAVNASGTFTNNGTYKGSGTYNTSLFNNPSGGIVTPGTSPGCQTYSNGFTNSGTLQIELGGTTMCTAYDRLNVTGTATLGGTLDVSLINSYVGNNGDQLTIINATALSGTFATVNLPANWYINYNLPSAGQVTLSYNAPITVGAALDLSGNNDYISLSGTTTLLDGATKFTVEHWIKSNGTGSVGIVGKGASGCCTNTIHTGLAANGIFFLKVGNQDGSITGAGVAPAGTWVHLAAVYDGTAANAADRIKIYKNGVLQVSSMFGSIPAVAPSPNVPFVIGAALSDGSFNYNGQIDEVRIWNTALTCGQIQQRYACELAGNEPNLAAYYKFNQGVAEGNNATITSLTDATSNAYNGTFTNLPRTGSTSNFIATGGVTTGTSCSAVVAPEINLKGNGNDITYGSTTPATSNHTDFGSVLVNGSFARTFTIDNSAGTGVLTISSITKSGTNQSEFTVSGITLPLTITAGNTATFTVTFVPTATGTRTATIEVNNNDCDEAVYDFAVTGNGALPGAALDFDGTDDYVSFPTTGMTSTAGTISFWMNAANTQSVGLPVIVELGTENVAIFLYDNGTKIFFRAGWTSNQFSVPFTGLGSWKHITMTWEGNGKLIKGYIDGVLAGSITMSGGASFGTAGYLGRSSLYANGTTNFKGSLDDIRFYNRALCADEIAQLRNCEVSSTSDNLQAYFKCNQGTGSADNTAITTLTDDATLIGGANNGTLSNFGLTSSTSNFIATGGVTTGTSCPAVVTPEINLKGNGNDITYGSTTPATSNHTDFGSVLVNGSLARTFTIDNSAGTAALAISSITSNNNTTFVVSNIPASVAAGSTATFTVTFNPTATGAQNATITVNNNDCDESSYTFAVTGTGESPGAALSFDGINDYVVTSTSPVLTGGGFTVELWAKRSGSGTYDIAVGQGSGGGGADNVLHVGFRDNNQFTFAFSYDDLDVNASYSDNNWHHWACVYTGAPAGSNNQFVYRDGVLVGSRTTNGSYGGSGPLTIGTVYYALTTDAFSGTIDEVRIWNTARSCEEIRQLRNCELTGSESNLVAYYKFNQGLAASDNSTITSLTDATANGNNGTFNGFALNGSTSNFITPGGVTTGTSCSAVVAPEINVQGNSQDIADGTTSTSTSNHTDFNGTFSRTFTIQNTGNSDLTISSITSSNTKFVVSGAPASVTMGASATFTITYNPTDGTAQTSIITINSNDCDEATYDFVVSASATAAKALHFNAGNNVTSPSFTAFGSQPVTIEFWAKNPSSFTFPVGFGNSVLFLFSNGNFVIRKDFVGDYNTGATVSTNGNTWEHFALTWDGVSTMRTYKNGQPTPTPSFSNFAGGAVMGTLQIGEPKGGYPYTGAIDEMRMWNEQRTDAQILASYNTEIAEMSPCLQVYWKFNQGFLGANNSSVTTATDIANASNHNGTLTNFTLSGSTSNWVAGSGITEVTSAYVPAPEANLKGIDNSTIADGTTTTSTAAGTNFGSVQVGNNVIRTFTFENTGNADLTVSNITSSNPLFTVSSISNSPIAGSNFATFTVTFTPTATGAQNATITVINNDCDEANYNFAVTGTGSCIAPTFSACPTNQTANTTTNACTATVNYTATATGTPTPTLSYTFSGATTGSGSGTGSGATFNRGTTTVIITASNGCGGNATCSFTVTVNDTEAPTLSCPTNQIFTANTCSANYTIADPITDNCTVATWGYTLSGATTATVSGIADGTGSGAISFNIGTTTVTLSGTDGTNAATGCSFTITVNAPEINLKGNTLDIADGDNTPRPEDHTDFGSVLVGNTVVRTFTIENTGTAVLNIGSITSNNAKFTVGSIPSSVPAMGSATFTVTFIPTTSGTQNATITINNDDCNEAAYDFAVTGSSTSNPNALHFDGADDNIEVPLNTTLFGTQSTTVEFWAKAAPGFAFPINFDGVTFSVVWGPTLKLNIWFGNSWDTGYPIEDCWHHYAFTYDGASGTMYAFVDGQPTPNPSFTGGWQGVSSSLTLGSRAGSYGWNGTMDELRIWNVQRTQSQLQANLYNELAGNETGLVAYYNFNQGTAGGNNASVTTLYDNQTNSTAKNGTLTNFALTGTTSNWITSGALIHYPEIDIQGNSVSIVDGDNTPSANDHTTFGDILVGANLARTYTIKNTGSEVLNVSSIVSSNPLFTVGTLTPASPIPIGQSATFTVTFAPSAVGTETAMITVNNDDCNEAVYDFAVTGNGANVGAALKFDGVDDYVDLGTSLGNFGTNDFTLETWFKTAQNSSNYVSLLSKRSSCNHDNFWNIVMVNGKIHFEIDENGTNYLDLITPLAYNDGSWHHVACVRSGTSLKIYMDGSLVTSGNTSGTTNLTNATSVKMGQSPCGNFIGDLDEVRIWNAARTCEEIKQLYNCELAGNEPNLNAYYKFNQGLAISDNSGISNLTDSSPNGYNGTFLNMPRTGSISNFITPGGVTTGTSCSAVVAPEINLKGNMVSIPDGNTTTSTTDHTDFGNVTVNTTLIRTFTIENTGNNPLTISSINSSNPLFTVGTLTPASPIPANGTATFTITFAPTATGVQNTTITINSNDCDEATYDFAVKATGECDATASITGTNSPICAGNNATFTLTGTSGAVVTYNLNNAPNTTITLTGGMATVTVTGATSDQTLNLVSVNNGICSINLTGNATVTVKPLPILNLPAKSLCVGATMTLSPNTGGTWSSSDGTKATITDAGIVTGVAAGSVTFTFTETISGCSNTTASVTVNPKPTSVVSGGGIICAGETLPNVSVALTGTGPWSLTYSNGTTFTPITGISSSPYVIMGAGAGTYTVIALSDANCTGTSLTGSASVVVNPLPTLTAGMLTNPTTCGGSNGSIAFTTTNLPNGSYTLNYSGSGSPKMVTVNNNAFTLSGLSAGNYSNFSITNLGCTGTFATTQSLSDPSAPTLTAGTITNPTACSGTNGSIAFTTTNLPNATYTLNYSGSGSPKMVTVNNNAFTLSGLTAGNYSNFSISNAGCTGTLAATQSLSDPSTPTLTAGTITNPTTCSGTNGSIAFTTTNLPNATYTLNYSGSGSPKMVTVNNNAFTLGGLTAGNYSNFSISNAGCTGTLAATQSLSDPSAPTLTAGTITNPTTCSGTNGSIAFTTTNLPNATYTLNYSGSGSPKMVTVNNNAFTLGGLTAGNYSNFSISNAGCTGTLAATQSLSDPSAPTASISTTSTAVCQNAPFPTVTFLGNGGITPYTFTYKINAGPNQTITTSSGNSVSLSQPTATAGSFNYTLVSVKDANGCEQLQSGSAIITVNALPELSFIGPNPVCQWYPSKIWANLPGTWTTNNPTKATIVQDGTISALLDGQVTFIFTVAATGCQTTSSVLVIKPTPVSALIASKNDVCPNTEVSLDARCSITTSTVNWNPGAPTVIPAAATLPYIYKARCEADGCVGNETSVEVRTHRILVDMKDLDVGALPLPIVRAVKDNMAPTNLIQAPVFPRRWTFIANSCDASESAEFKLSGPVLFNAIDNSGTYAMFANEGNSFYSIDHPNYGNGGSFPNGTYTLTINLRSKDGAGGPYPKNRVATGALLATRTLQFTVGGQQAIVSGRQSAVVGPSHGSEQWAVGGEQWAVVAPNPVFNTMRLKISEAKGQKVNVSLMDASGRTLLQRGFVPETNAHQEEFNVSTLANGMYFLKVNAGEKQATLKVLKVQ